METLASVNEKSNKTIYRIKVGRWNGVVTNEDRKIHRVRKQTGNKGKQVKRSENGGSIHSHQMNQLSKGFKLDLNCGGLMNRRDK